MTTTRGHADSCSGADTDFVWASYVEAENEPIIRGISLDPNCGTRFHIYAEYVYQCHQLPALVLRAAKSLGTKVGAAFVYAEITECKFIVPFASVRWKSQGPTYAGTQAVAAAATDYTSQRLSIKANVRIPRMGRCDDTARP